MIISNVEKFRRELRLLQVSSTEALVSSLYAIFKLISHQIPFVSMATEYFKAVF